MNTKNKAKKYFIQEAIKHGLNEQETIIFVREMVKIEFNERYSK